MAMAINREAIPPAQAGLLSDPVSITNRNWTSLETSRIISGMVPGDDCHVVIGLPSPTMGHDGLEQASAGPDRILGIEAPCQCQQPFFAELPSRRVSGLDHGIGIEQDEVAPPEMHRELLVGRLVVEPPWEVADIADGRAQETPRAVLGTTPQRARMAGVRDREAFVDGQICRDDGRRETLHLGDLGELAIQVLDQLGLIRGVDVLLHQRAERRSDPRDLRTMTGDVGQDQTGDGPARAQRHVMDVATAGRRPVGATVYPFLRAPEKMNPLARCLLLSPSESDLPNRRRTTMKPLVSDAP